MGFNITRERQLLTEDSANVHEYLALWDKSSATGIDGQIMSYYGKRHFQAQHAHALLRR